MTILNVVVTVATHVTTHVHAHAHNFLDMHARHNIQVVTFTSSVFIYLISSHARAHTQ